MHKKIEQFFLSFHFCCSLVRRRRLLSFCCLPLSLTNFYKFFIFLLFLSAFWFFVHNQIVYCSTTSNYYNNNNFCALRSWIVITFSNRKISDIDTVYTVQARTSAGVWTINGIHSMKNNIRFVCHIQLSYPMVNWCNCCACDQQRKKKKN